MAGQIDSGNLDKLTSREWLVTNGLGGYASSSIPCLNSRKYHGLLVAAMSPPVRRMVLLSRLEETVICDGWPSQLATNDYPGTIHPEGHRLLRAFSYEPFPRWAYQADGWTLEKSLHLLPGENTVCLSYTLLGGDRPIDLLLTPLLALRGIHELMFQWNGRLLVETRSKGTHRVPPTIKTPEVFFSHDGTFEPVAGWYFDTIYRREQERGYAGLEDLWSPGVVRKTLMPGQSVRFACSTDPIDLEEVLKKISDIRVAHAPLAVAPTSQVGRALSGYGGGAAETAQAQVTSHLPVLLQSANQFIAHSVDSDGGKTVAIVAQYPWSPPSVRWGLVSLPGLLLTTGRYDEAKSYLISLAEMADAGLLPSEILEDTGRPLFTGADVSLWYVNAVDRYLAHTSDLETVRRLFPVLRGIIDAYQNGTHLGIGIGADGLLHVGVEGAAVTWMNSQVQGDPITPRVGSPVELNALYYNALSIMAALSEKLGEASHATALRQAAALLKTAFNSRFWNASAECCYDVVRSDGRDAAVRPNQLLAASLPYPVLDANRLSAMIETVGKHLLTPFGLRTLGNNDPAYQGHYAGNAIARDWAHHNGSAHPWLLGPFVTAFIRSRGTTEDSRAIAAEMLLPSLRCISGDGLGQLCELFDGDVPQKGGGAIASAAGIAEILRCYVEDVLGISPAPITPTSPLATPPIERGAVMPRE